MACLIGVYHFLLVIIAAVRIAKPLLTDEFLLMAGGRSGKLWQTSLDGLQRRIIIDDRNQNIVDVDYNPVTQHIYWTDVSGAKLYRCYLNGSEPEIFLQLTPASQPEGVAVDAVAQLVFFTDNGKNSINVVKESGQDTTELIRDASNPRSIALHPDLRKIVWGDWGLGAIEEAFYDGTGRRVILQSNGPAWINGLELDLSTNRIFWTNAYNNSLQSSGVNGDNQILLTNGQIYVTNRNTSVAEPHYFGIAVDESFIYFTDWTTKTLYRSNKNGENIVALSGDFDFLNDITLYNSSLYHFGSPSPCRNQNGGCSNLCIPTRRGAVCACPDLKRLEADNKTCSVEEHVNGPQLIWLEHDQATTSFIRGINGEPRDYLRTQILSLWRIPSPSWYWRAIDVDYANNNLYLVDQLDRYIVQLSLTNMKINVVYNGTSPQVNGIAYDWVAGNVYWTDAIYNWIMMAKAIPNTIYHKTVIDSGLDTPHGVAVWPQRGLLVWTDWGVEDKVEVASLTGENRRMLWGRNLNRPKGISVDYTNSRVYWCTSRAIQSVHYDGLVASDFRVHGGSRGDNFVDVAVHMNYVFAVEQTRTPRLWFFNNDRTSATGVNTQLLMQPSGVAMYDERRQDKGLSSGCSQMACDHMCVGVDPGIPQCVCSDGYLLAPDNKTCTKDSSLLHEPSYIYSIGDRLCILAIRESLSTIASPNDLCFYKNAQQSEFRALQYNFLQGEIYFSDNGDGVRSIRRASIVTKNNNSDLIQGVGTVNGIAIDWVSNNIYFTDAKFGQIMLARTTGIHQHIVAKNLSSPFGIVLDAKRNKLYWSEQGDNNHSPAIKESDLQGLNVRALVTSGLVKPAGMVVDMSDDRLYWLDHGSNTLSYLDLGTNETHNIRLPVSNGQPMDVYDLAIFQDQLILSGRDSTNTSCISITEKGQGSPTARPIEIKHQGSTSIFDVIAFSSQNQPFELESSESCAVDNGGCEHLCVAAVDYTHTCICAEGYKLASDSQSCLPLRLLEDNFFLIADDFRYQIYQADAKLQVISAVNTPALDRPISLDYDFIKNQLYWTDFRDSVIKGSFLNGSDVKTLSTKREGSRIDGIAFESQSQLLYFTDTSRNEIGILKPATLTRKILVRNKGTLTNPRAIALDPTQGHFYYTTRRAGAGTIQRRNLDGSDRVTLVSARISWPTGLTLDLEEGRMYWCDAHTEYIESANLDGQNRKRVFQVSPEGDPFGITVQGKSVFWTDWKIRGVHSVLKNGSNYEVRHEMQFTGLNDIKYCNKSAAPPPNACSTNNGGCSHFCIPMPNDTRACACPDDKDSSVPTIDGRNCPNLPMCTGMIPNGLWAPNCSRQVGTQCNFTCFDGFTAKSNISPHCTQDQIWNTDLADLCSDVTCSILEIPANAVIDGKCPLPAVVGTSCRHACEEGYVEAGGSEIRVCIDRVWSGRPLQCRPMGFCPPLKLPENAKADRADCTVNRQAQGTTCVFSCADGYTIEENEGFINRVCMNSFVWSGRDIGCVEMHDGNNAPNKSALASGPLIGGIVGGVSVLVIILIVVGGVLWCRRSGKERQRQASRRFRNERSSSDGDGDVTPTPHYKTDIGQVSLGAFDNPMYATHAEVEAYRNVTQPNLQATPDPDMNANGGAGPLPDKTFLLDDDLMPPYQDTGNIAFENPMFK